MQAWDSFLEKQQMQMGEETVDRWLRPLKIVHFDAGNLYLEAESSFQIDWFEEHVRPEARKSLLNNNFRPIKVHLTCTGTSSPKEMANKHPSRPIEFSFTLTRDPLLPEYTKENFLFTPSNRIIERLLEQTVSGSDPSFNPIFFYGGPGLGKTHLLQALASELQKNRANVLYVRAETFTENLVRAIRSGNVAPFRSAYRNIDVLLVDDVEHFGRKTATQEEFFHTFNSLHNRGKQIILSANVPPGSLSHIEPRLISRFEWGLSLPIIKPEPEELPIIVDRLSKRLGLILSEASDRFLIEQFSGNLSSIRKALDALYMRASSSKRPLTPNKIALILKDLLEKETKEVVSPEKILAHTAELYGIGIQEILSKSQTQECVVPRQVAMFLCRNRLKMPFTKIGEYFHRDHSTVIAGVKNIEEKMLAKDKEIGPNLAILQQKLL